MAKFVRYIILLLVLLAIRNSTAYSINIDGNFSDWQAVLSDPSLVVYDGPWASMTDLDTPSKTGRDLVRFASIWDDDYIYLYFERLADHEHIDVFVYIDADNDGLMENGEPIAYYKWSKDKRRYEANIGIYYPNNSGGDTMNCGDGCTMPGKSKTAWKKIEKLQGSSEDFTKLETRLDWDWLNTPIRPDCKSCEKIYSLTMQLDDSLIIFNPTNVSVYEGENINPSKLKAKYPITPENTTFTIAHLYNYITIAVDGTDYSETIHTSCDTPIGPNMTFDEFDTIDWNATQKKDCMAPEGFDPADLQLHISSAKGKNIPKYVVDNMNTSFLMLADIVPPAISWVKAEPGKSCIGQMINFTAKVTDNIAVSSVLLDINGIGYLMTKDGDDVWYYLWNATSAGNYNFTVWANDTSNNWASKSSNFTVLSSGLAIALSSSLSSAVSWNVSALPAYNLSAQGNNGAGVTEYYVTVEAICLNADLYVKADGNLTSGANQIPLKNEKISFSTTDSTVPSAIKKSLTTNYTDNQIGYNMTNSTKSWLKFFLDVSGNQQAGDYSNNLTFKVVQTGYSP